MISTARPFWESDDHRFSAVGILHGLRAGIARFRNAHTDGKRGLVFVHSVGHFVAANCVPGFGRPEVVQLARVLVEEHLVGIEGDVAAALEADGHGVGFAILVEDGEHLATCMAARGDAGDVLDLDFLDRQEHSGRMLEVGGALRVGINGVSITFFHPHRLFRQLLRRFQAGDVESPRNDVSLAVERARSDGIHEDDAARFCTLPHDDDQAHDRNDNQDQE
ncbi:MAG TPA: hypothetical protein VII81_13775 [Terriglobales bacterium]